MLRDRTALKRLLQLCYAASALLRLAHLLGLLFLSAVFRGHESERRARICLVLTALAQRLHMVLVVVDVSLVLTRARLHQTLLANDALPFARNDEVLARAALTLLTVHHLREFGFLSRFAAATNERIRALPRFTALRTAIKAIDAHLARTVRLEAFAAVAHTAALKAITVVAALIAPALTRTAVASLAAFTRKGLALAAAPTRKTVTKYAEMARLEGHDRQKTVRTVLRVHEAMIGRFERIGRLPLQLTARTEK